MVKFVPKWKHDSSGSKSSAINNLSLKCSQNIVDGLNFKDIKLNCNIHPHTVCIISIDVMENPMYEIESICCDHFKKEVEKYLGLNNSYIPQNDIVK